MPVLISPCGGASCASVIDSTATAGDACGVHSVGATSGKILTADGAGGSSWAAAGAAYAPSPATGVYNVASVNIAANGSSTGSLVYVRGTAVLDLTTPTSPKVVTQGVYFIGGSFQSGTAFNAGRGLLGLLFVNSNPTVDAYMSAETRSNTIGPNGFVATTVPCAVDTNMSFTLTNSDTATRGCEWVEIVVTLICVY